MTWTSIIYTCSVSLVRSHPFLPLHNYIPCAGSTFNQGACRPWWWIFTQLPVWWWWWWELMYLYSLIMGQILTLCLVNPLWQKFIDDAQTSLIWNGYTWPLWDCMLVCSGYRFLWWSYSLVAKYCALQCLTSSFFFFWVEILLCSPDWGPVGRCI